MIGLMNPVRATILDQTFWTNFFLGQYNPNDPQYSHFTQMVCLFEYLLPNESHSPFQVWKDTTQIGCAMTECQGIFDSNYGVSCFISNALTHHLDRFFNSRRNSIPANTIHKEMLSANSGELLALMSLQHRR